MMMTTPGMGETLLLGGRPGPRFDLDQGHTRQLGHCEGAACRTVITKRRHVGLVHEVEIAHMAKEDGGLYDVGK